MPKIVVEGPDGRKFAFPDTMPRAEINAFMKQKYGTKARNETVQDYLARVVREEEATKARAKDIDVKATAAGRAEGERAAERMGVDNPFLMAFAAPAIGLAQQSAARDVYNREGTVLADEAAGLSAINAAGFFVPGMVNKEFGAQLEEGRRQQPLAAFAGDVAGGFGPGEIIGAGVSKAVQAIGPGMAALGRMLSRGPGPDTSNAIVGGTLGGIAPAETAEERARNVAVGAGLGYVARPGSKLAADLTTPSAPSAMPDAMPAGGYFGRQSMRPPGSGPSAREIETQQQWSTATPIVTQARTTAQSAQQAADAALQSKAPADIARAKDQKKALVGQLQEAQASRAGMDTPEDARLAETLASLAENTSDPVLLSTQISAAKTSLDRLLTDIGSPVEGNLIPVRTNILTRTQAPRSAAEGPQDRASVTRYAEGGDEIKPQGFVGGGLRYGNDPTKTENIFRDVTGKPFNADKEATRRLSRMQDNGNYIDVKLPTNRLNATQSTVNPGFAENTANRYMEGYGGVEAPAVVKYKGEYYVTDGHHRITTAAMRNGSDVRVRLYDLDGNTDPSTPLLDFNPERYAKDKARRKKEDDQIYKFLFGGDDIKPMGFGASTPKTPQQAARFETPGSPEYEAAVAKGLDMSQAGRMGRAREMGFDTDTVLYHGTTDKFSAFDPKAFGGQSSISESGAKGVWMTNSKNVADFYGEMSAVSKSNRQFPNWEDRPMAMTARETARENKQIMPLVVRGRLKEIDMGGAKYSQDMSLSKMADEAKAEGFDGVKFRNFVDGPEASDHVLIFDPSNIRSVNAAFDPDKATSSTLLAAAPFAAVSGAGLTSERELGSKMKRDKKD